MRFVSYYSRAISDSSGVTAALWAWAKALVDAGQEVVVAHAGGPRRSPDPSLDVRGAQDVVVRHVGNRRPTYTPVGLGRVLNRGDVLLLHEGWVLSNDAAAAIARAKRVPYVVVPHGVYEPGILRTLKPPRRLRNRIERALLENALAVHVFWETEGPLVRAVAPAATTLVVPTGFDPPNYGWRGGGGYIAWLGRYDPEHKGLDVLLRAVASMEPAARPLVEMRGPDYAGGLGRLERLVGELDVASWIRLRGPVYGDAKRDFLTRADGYVHPSRWESHSIALLENLAIGVPSVVSSAIHIAPELRAADAAIVTPPTVDGIAAGLRAVPRAAAELKTRGPKFIRERLAWPTVTAQFVEGIDRLRDRRY
jgi:glycosyltransferase involved in cell wall biosynthesis